MWNILHKNYGEIVFLNDVALNMVLRPRKTNEFLNATRNWIWSFGLKIIYWSTMAVSGPYRSLESEIFGQPLAYHIPIGCYRHSGKRTDPIAGIVYAHTRMKMSVCYRAISAQIIISLKYLLWTIATSKLNYVCNLWITISFLWFVC